jgi:hypothetical protein
MTATYTNDPASRPIDTVRFEVADTNTTSSTTVALSDEEIQYLIDTNNHVLYAAAAAAEQIGGQSASGLESKSVGDFKLTFPSGDLGSYSALASALRVRAARKAGGSLYAGGLTKTDKGEMETDVDRVQPVFSIGMDDNETV